MQLFLRAIFQALNSLPDNHSLNFTIPCAQLNNIRIQSMKKELTRKKDTHAI